MVNVGRLRISGGFGEGDSSRQGRKPRFLKLLCPVFAEETAGTGSQGGNGQGVGVGTSAATSGGGREGTGRLGKGIVGNKRRRSKLRAVELTERWPLLHEASGTDSTASTASVITAGREGNCPRGNRPHRRRTEAVEGTPVAARILSMVNPETSRKTVRTVCASPAPAAGRRPGWPGPCPRGLRGVARRPWSRAPRGSARPGPEAGVRCMRWLGPPGRRQAAVSRLAGQTRKP